MKKFQDLNGSGWRVLPVEIEFWVDVEGRVHERLNYRTLMVNG